VTTSLTFFAPCPRGLEEVLTDELSELGMSGMRAVPGGAHFTGSLTDAYRVNLHSRLASRVLWQIASGPYRNEEDVYRLAERQPWGDWFDVDDTIRVDVSATKSPLRSLEFATLRVKDGVCDHLRSATGHRPSVDTRAPDVRIYAYLDALHCTLYLDTSGEALFKRGWRAATGEAPLRENLAAGVLRLAGWRPGRPLMDPMCGSGTFIIEAAQMCLGIAPGSQRAFGFEKLRNFDADAWHALQEKCVARPVVDDPKLCGSDVAGDSIVQTRANLIRAGVDAALVEQISLKQIDARHIRPHAPAGLMVVNPPYGERIGVRGAADDTTFFAEFGDILKQRFAGWQCSILSSDLAFQKKLRLAPSRRTPLFNGAIECRLYRFELVEGSARRPASSAASPSSPPEPST
jgi:putative N6-adenine-specific DNA methylase